MKNQITLLNDLSEKINLILFYSITLRENEICFQGKYYCDTILFLNHNFSGIKWEVTDSGYVQGTFIYERTESRQSKVEITLD